MGNDSHYLCKFVPTREELTTKSTKSAKFFCSFSFVFFAFFVVRQKSANIVDQPFTSLDEVFEQMERAIGRWCREQGVELVDSRGRGIPFPED